MPEGIAIKLQRWLRLTTPVRKSQREGSGLPCRWVRRPSFLPRYDDCSSQGDRLVSTRGMLISSSSASSPSPWRLSRPSSGGWVVCGSRRPQLTQISRGGRSLVLATRRAPQEGQAKKLASGNHPRLPGVRTSGAKQQRAAVARRSGAQQGDLTDQRSAGLTWETCNTSGRAS